MLDDRSRGASKVDASATRRWLQFRLRTLLIAVVLLCLGLGGGQIYWTHFANYVIADPVRVGEPIHVRGQVFDWSDASSVIYTVELNLPRPGIGMVTYQSKGGRIAGAGQWIYRVEAELPPVSKPGEYEVRILPVVFHPIGQQRPRQLPPLRGKVTIRPRDEPEEE